MNMFGRDYFPDDRDRKFGFTRKKKTTGRRYWNCPVNKRLDQGNIPSCVGHAWVHWLCSAPISNAMLDAHGVYRLAQHFDEWEGTNYDGTSVRAGAKIIKQLGFIQEYRWASTVDDIATAVIEIGPVVVGTDWLEGMGIRLHAFGIKLGGHAYLINGVNTKRKMFRILNSWGDNWGNRGHGNIPFWLMHKLLKDDGEAAVAIERKP